MTIPVGTKIAWWSGAGGASKLKQGIVRAYIPSMHSPKEVYPEIANTTSSQRKFDSTDYGSSNHRYLIEVPRASAKTGKSIASHWYTPLASNIERQHANSTSK